MDPALIVAVLAFVAIGGAGIVLTSNNQPSAGGKRVKAVGATKNVDRRKQAGYDRPLPPRMQMRFWLVEQDYEPILRLTIEQLRRHAMLVPGPNQEVCEGKRPTNACRRERDRYLLAADQERGP